jgi:hypothetical protein
MLVVVRQAEESAPIQVDFITDRADKLVLHWGATKPGMFMCFFGTDWADWLVCCTGAPPSQVICVSFNSADPQQYFHKALPNHERILGCVLALISTGWHSPGFLAILQYCSASTSHFSCQPNFFSDATQTIPRGGSCQLLPAATLILAGSGAASLYCCLNNTHMMVENDLNSGRQWRCVLFSSILVTHTHVFEDDPNS